MRTRGLALAALLLLSLSGCAVVDQISDTASDAATSRNDLIMKTDLANAATAIVAYGTDSPGAFPTDVSELAPWGYTPSEGQQPVTFSGDASDFCVQGVAESGTTFHIVLQSGVQEGACP